MTDTARPRRRASTDGSIARLQPGAKPRTVPDPGPIGLYVRVLDEAAADPLWRSLAIRSASGKYG